MAVTQKAYGKFAANLMKGNINLLSDTIKVMLVDGTYTPDQDAHEFKSSVTGEITGTGYTGGGQVLTNKTVTYDNATNQARFDADDPQWTTATLTARTAVFYKDTGTAATSPLIAYIQSSTDISSTANNFFVTLDATGLVYIAAA